MERVGNAANPRRAVSKALILSLGLINLVLLLIAAVYFYGGVTESSPPSMEYLVRGLPREELISLRGAPDHTVLGAEGKPIDKFKTSGEWFLYVFYDEDTRVSSYFLRRY